MIAALVAATAAKPGLGSSAALPDMKTTEPLACFRESQARIVKRRAPCNFNSMPAFHASSVLEEIDLWHSACDIQQCVYSPETLKCSVDDNFGCFYLA